MKTIQKRADEIKRGDIIVDFLRAADVRVPAVVLGDYCNGSVKIFDAADTISRVMIGYESTVTVDAPSLTTAQLHAEELLDFVERVAFIGNHHALPEEAHTLLEKIKPPEPPTLEEALQSLSLVMRSDVHDAVLYREYADAACRILTRARRAGLLP